MFLPQKHGDGFFAVSNEQTDLPVTYNYMHTCLDCNFFSALIFGKHLATASLLRTTSIASKPDIADSMFTATVHLEVMSDGSRCNHVVLILLERLNCPRPWKSQCSNYGRKYVLLSKKSGTAFRSVLDLQQLHIPWDPGGLSVCEQTAA